MRTYIRDKRSPKPTNSNISKVMSANKAKNTKPELKLRKLLWKNGIRGYRIHKYDIPGRPDIAFIKNKIAIFVNGCFWHRCPYCNLKLPKHNRAFWEEKFGKNENRDRIKSNQLKINGWKVITLWECEIKNNLDESVMKITMELR